MNYVLARPNSKGQIVIPKKFRDELGIDEEMFLSLSLRGNGIYLTPFEKTSSLKNSRELWLEVLKRTAGSWAGDSWPETEKRRRKIELAASKKRKKAW
jgi:AbrB family looped-hinge helix DNA binding protein